jgi:hypothetical protein
MSRRVYTVWRNMHTKHGTVIQTALRTFSSEAVAKSVSEEAHRDLMTVMLAELSIGGASLGFGVGKLFTELGIASVSHTIGWSDVHDTDVVLERVH